MAGKMKVQHSVEAGDKWGKEIKSLGVRNRTIKTHDTTFRGRWVGNVKDSERDREVRQML